MGAKKLQKRGNIQKWVSSLSIVTTVIKDFEFMEVISLPPYIIKIYFYYIW